VVSSIGHIGICRTERFSRVVLSAPHIVARGKGPDTVVNIVIQEVAVKASKPDIIVNVQRAKVSSLSKVKMGLDIIRMRD
jgi:hypothetical protein